MSFSSEVKEELAKQLPKSRHCQLAELAAMLSLTAKISVIPTKMELETENPLVLQTCAALMKQAFGIDVTSRLSLEDVTRVVDALKITGLDNSQAGVWESEEHGRTSGLLLQRTCCKRAFLRGAFLAAGSVSDPNKSYHFEIVAHTPEQALQLQELMQEFELDAKIVERKGHQVVYLKEGAQIVDMLNVMEAYVALMSLENVRIVKEMRNSINRRVNCETANISKTVNAAVKQVEDIIKIRDTIGFDELPAHLREMAQVRLENPDVPLKELGTYLDPPVGKSGVNHRLRRLSEIAESCP